MTTMAALAGATRRLKSGMNVTRVTFRDPLVLARECATIDFLSNGPCSLCSVLAPTSLRRAGDGPLSRAALSHHPEVPVPLRAPGVQSNTRPEGSRAT